MDRGRDAVSGTRFCTNPDDPSDTSKKAKLFLTRVYHIKGLKREKTLIKAAAKMAEKVAEKMR